MNERIVMVGVVVLASVLAEAAAPQGDAPRDARHNTISVSDGKTIVEFSSADKGTAAAVRRGKAGENLLTPQPDLWVLELTEGSVHSSEADSFSVQPDPDGAVLRWRFGKPKLSVRVLVRGLSGERGVEMHWSAQSAEPAGLLVKDIRFPLLRAAKSLTSVTYPGVGRSAVQSADGRYGGLYPGAQAAVQFFAAWSAASDGLYVGAHDGQGYTKTLIWNRRLATFTFHQPDPQKPRKDLETPYPVVMAAFKGDWQDGADYYRNWAWHDAPWCQRGTLAQTGPEWARTSAAWFYWVARYPAPLKQLAPRLREVFALRGAIGVHALDPGTQDHSNMPTAKPEDWVLLLKLRQLPLLRKYGYYVFEYRNAHKYTKGFRGYEQALPYAMRWNGKLHEEGPYPGGPDFHSRWVPPGTPGSATWGAGEDVYGEKPCSQKYPLTEMCIGAQFWQDKLVEMVSPCPGYGLMGNYLDQIGYNPNASRCDAPNHGHPLRGGNWYIRGHEKALRRIIGLYRQAGVDHPLLSHEFFCEPLLGLLNTALVNWDIRLLSYVYHPYVIFESHNIYGWGNPDLARLREEVAHDFHSGRMPALTVPCTLPGVDLAAALRGDKKAADAPTLRMLRRWFTVRAAWLRYLNRGAMLHTPKLSPGTGRIMTSAWRSPNGDVALFFSNPTGQTQTLVFDPSGYPVRGEWRAWKNDRKQAPRNHGLVRLNLAPDDTLVLEFSTSAAAGETDRSRQQP